MEKKLGSHCRIVRTSSSVKKTVVEIHSLWCIRSQVALRDTIPNYLMRFFLQSSDG